MFKPFFDFEPMDVEIRRKLESMHATSDDLFAELVGGAKTDGLGQDGVTRIEGLYAALCEQNAGDGDGSALNHPIRVAATWWKMSGKHIYETLAFGLCHNIRETGNNALQGIEDAFLSSASRGAIGLLTIDRGRERDLSYLASYYDAIVEHGNGLMTLKGLDKLDNFLSYPLYDLDPYYFMVVDDYVTPRLAKENAALASYLQSVADCVRTESAKVTYRALEIPQT